MFIKLKSGAMLNLYWLQDCFQGKHNKSIVIFYLVNGVKLIEEYDTEQEASNRVMDVDKLMDKAGMGGGLVQKDTYSDFPDTGSKGFIYIAKDTGATYYWDEATSTYIGVGTSGRTGVYSVDQALPSIVGTTTTINKSDLVEILKPTVDFSDGSEVIGNNSIHSIIVSSTSTTVDVKTITDLTIDSFQQVNTITDLPKNGKDNILYFVKESNNFKIWNGTTYVDDRHPIIIGSVPIAQAKLDTIYVDGTTIKYTTDNVNWIEISTGTSMCEYLCNTDLDSTILNTTKIDITDLDGNINIQDVELQQLVYTSNGIIGKIVNINTTTNKLDIITLTTSGGGGSGGDAKLTENITSNVLVGAAPANTLFKKDTTFTEFAKKILLKEIAPTITFNATNSGLKEVGTSVSGSKLTTNITSLGTGTVTSIEFYEGSNLLDTQSYVAGTNSYSFNYTNTITTNTTFKTIVYYTKADGTNSTINQTKSITFVYASYYGTVSTLTPVESDIKSLNKSIKNTKAFTWNNITVTDERFCYAYPKSFGALTSIKDANNFEYIGSYTKSTIQIDSVDYYLYVLTDPTTGSGFKQIYN